MEGRDERASAASEPSTSSSMRYAEVAFERLGAIGEGTYGKVYKARDKATGELVALKRVKMEKERDGVPVTTLRELRILQTCRHPNVVGLREVVLGQHDDSIYLVLEYCEHDMTRLMEAMKRRFSESEVKGILKQLLEGVAFMHDRWVTHRDLKLSNLLLRGGILKICDFGLARCFHPHKDTAYTPRVVTLWYRAPEVLLGSGRYDEAIDLWSVGCIFAELVKNAPLFPSNAEVETLNLMCRLLGTPTEDGWPGLRDMPAYRAFQFQPQPINHLRETFPELSDTAVDLLGRLLTYDPEKRITAKGALRHPYFSEFPLPKRPEDFPTFPSTQDQQFQIAQQKAKDDKRLAEEKRALNLQNKSRHKRYHSEMVKREQSVLQAPQVTYVEAKGIRGTESDGVARRRL